MDTHSTNQPMTTTRTINGVYAILSITLGILRKHNLPFAIRALETSTEHCPCNTINNYYETA